MNTLMILPALLSFSMILACKSKQDTAQETNSSSKPPATSGASTIRMGGEAAADSLVLSLERTPCFGHCQAYRLHVYRSGYATYEGRVNVELEGMHEARIGRDTLETLLREADRIGFFALDDVYDSEVTDLPSTILRISSNGRDKQVLGRVGTPAKFMAFVETIEEMILPVAWKPIRPQE
jgi:hypothetical protein